MKPVLAYFFIFLFSTTVLAQTDLKGLWNGFITTDGLNAQANYIINIEEQKDGIISGRALLYKPNIYAEAFGLQQFFGAVDKEKITITDVTILDERIPTNAYFLCFKLSNLDYTNIDGVESLTGNWRSNSPSCLPGQISLSRYHETDNSKHVPEYVLKVVRNPENVPRFQDTHLSSAVVLNVRNLNLELQLKDYLKTDNDTVSIYLNRRLIVNRLSISKKPFKFNIRLSRNLASNELILYANNLGRIPPNTSLLTISDGEMRHKILIESTLQKSVAIYLKRTDR